LISLKLKTKTPESLIPYLREYQKAQRCLFNLMRKRGLSKLEACDRFEADYTYNRTLIPRSHLLDHVGIKADMTFKSFVAKGSETLTFGGVGNWKRLHKGLLPAEEFDTKRNLDGCLYTGRTSSKGNMTFTLNPTSNMLVFKPSKGVKIELPYKTSKKRQRMLERIKEVCDAKLAPFAVELGKDYVTIIVDESKFFRGAGYAPVAGRVAALDVNPNVLGLAITDFSGSPDDLTQSPVHKECVGLHELNATRNTRKVKSELDLLAQSVARRLTHFQVETVGLEKLTMGAKDQGKGRAFNRLVNNDWKRLHFRTRLVKWLNILGVQHQEVLPQYSSTIGCAMHPEETDAVAAALELARRAHVFHQRFILKHKDFSTAPVVYPPFPREALRKRWNSSEEFPKTKLGWVGFHEWLKAQSKLTSLRLLYQDFVFDGNWVSYSPGKGESLVRVHTCSGSVRSDVTFVT